MARPIRREEAPSQRPGPSREALAFALNEVAGKRFNSDANGRSLMTVAERELGAGPILHLEGSRGSFTPQLAAGKGYDNLQQQALGTGHFNSKSQFDQAAAKAMGADALTPELRAQIVAEAQGNQKFQSSAYMGSANAAHAALEGAGEMLVAPSTPGQLYDVMGVTPSALGRRYAPEAIAEEKAAIGARLLADDGAILGELGINADKLRAKYGAAAGDGFEAEVKAKLAAGKVQEAIEQIGFTAEQLKTVIKPEVNTIEGFNAPLLKDMPAWGQAAAIAGAGAASGALAMHLMAQGQQQINNADYAAAVQSLNAY